MKGMSSQHARICQQPSTPPARQPTLLQPTADQRRVSEQLTLSGGDESCSKHRTGSWPGSCQVAALQALLVIQETAPHVQLP